MIYDFDPRTNRENLNSKSYPRRLIEDILTNKIVESMSFGTASNYFTRSYGPNHRIIYEGVARLLADILVGTLDNIEDVEYSQLRAEFVATRLMYLVFPDEDSVPVGDSHKETISFLLQTYEALLKGATKKSIDEVLNDIAEGNAIVASTIEGYITNIKSSILATTEYNKDGVFTEHRHFSFTDETGLGSTGKPIDFKWGDKLHTHDIVEGVIQPHIDENGNSHTHEVYLGLPENIVRLQSNLRKVFRTVKPAHIKTGEISSIVDEDVPFLTKSKEDVFSPILGIDPNKTDGEIITENTIDPSIPYHNQNALYGLVGLSLGNLYQEDMRKAREGVYEPNTYGYVSGKTIRFWRTNIKVADNIIIGNQKLRVISVSERIVPLDGTYTPISDSEGEYTYKKIRELRKGEDPNRFNEDNRTLTIVNGSMYPPTDPVFGNLGAVFFQDVLNDGEPVNFRGEIYFCDLMANNVPVFLDQDKETNDWGHKVRLSYIEVKVDANIALSGLQLVRNNSSTWDTRDQILYETATFDYYKDEEWKDKKDRIFLPSYIYKDMLKTINGLPVRIHDLEVLINGSEIDFSVFTISLSHTNADIVPFYKGLNPQKDSLMIFSHYKSGRRAKALVENGDQITIRYPKAKSEIRRFRELNSLEMTLNAVRPTRKVSESGRGIGQNRVIETTSPISYVLNEPEPITPYTQEQKTATYSAGSSDLLNTENQNIYYKTKIEDLGSLPNPLLFNSTYTLNNFSLNQTATQEQVYKPATKTITTFNPTITFYELGFKPQYITSVVDTEGHSYTYTLNQGHVLVEGLTSEKTLIISGLSSNPFRADLDWYKGDKLGEGAAFYKHTSTLDLGAFTEPTPEEYMTNPLGLAPDQIRSIYSMVDTKTSGVEGEMTFFEDVITEYKIDGRDGFTDEYNPHNPQDELLYQDPTLYILGPRSQIEEGGSVNTIPTYLFFNYMFLNLFGRDGYYFSIYRIDTQGVKQYQTLTPRADGNGFNAISQYPSLPAPNGSPLAYTFVDDGSGGGMNLNYHNGVNPDYIAEINAEFNHIPNETYYLELHMEEDGGGDGLHFFSSGTDADYTLGTSWFISGDTYRLDNEANPGADRDYIYEVTFTTNPGEVASFNSVADPNPTATKQSENVGITHSTSITTFYAEDYYPIRPLELGFEQLWKNNFVPEGMFFTSFKDYVPKPSDSHHVPPMVFAPVSVSSIITFSDNISTSLLLYPASITETVGEITDNVIARFNYDHIILNDTVNFTDEFLFSAKLNLVKVFESDNIPKPSDSIIVPTYQRYVPSSNYPVISDDGFTRWRAYRVSSSVSITDEPLLVSYSYLPRSVSDTVPSATDSISRSFNYTPINESDLLPSLVDEAKAWISSVFVYDTWGWGFFFGQEGDFEDSVSTTYNYLPRGVSDSTSSILDGVIVPNYMTLTPNDFTNSISDSVNASLQLYHRYLQDSVPKPTDTAPSVIFNYTPVSENDSMITITDTVQTELGLILSANYPLITDQENSFISSTTQTDTTNVSVTDGATTTLNIAVPSLLIALRYDGYADNDNELFSIYKGYMDTLEYPAIVDLQPDSNSTTAVGIHNGTPSSAPTITNERYVYALGPNAYNNTNMDANVRIGPLEFDTTYTMYSYTEYPGDTRDIQAAMKTGISSSDPEGFLSGVNYTDIMKQTSGSTDKYYLHEFYIRSSDNAVIFTAGTPNSFPFGNVDTTPIVRLYIHFKYTYTQGTSDGADFFGIRPAGTGWSHSLPNGSPSDFYGWLQPDIHAQITGLANAIDSNNVYNYTTLPNFSVSNTNNDAQLSIELEVGVRYQFRCLIDDQDPDFQIYLEARTNDNGASWNTVYNSSSSLTYTETVQRDDDGRRSIYHFFTIRRDGFIIWEQDPDSVS